VVENKVTTITPEVTWKCGGHDVTGIVRVSYRDLIVVYTYSRSVYVYENDTQGEPIRTFTEHKDKINGVVHLCDDIVASVDDAGILLTWSATAGNIIDNLKISEKGCWSITKAGATRILVGTEKGEIIVVQHESGKNLAVKKRCTSESKGGVYDTSAYNDICAAIAVGSYGCNAEVWDVLNGEHLRTIEIKKESVELNKHVSN